MKLIKLLTWFANKINYDMIETRVESPVMASGLDLRTYSNVELQRLYTRKVLCASQCDS